MKSKNVIRIFLVMLTIGSICSFFMSFTDVSASLNMTKKQFD